MSDKDIVPVDTENKNMELWNKVCKTNPQITKSVNQRGGFTAIDAQAQIKKATELWGSYGDKWGVKDCKYGFININKLNEDNEIEKQHGITLTAVFYYPEGEFELASDMFYQPRNDCMKKLLTDLTTKALSKLGFNSDVFEGKFDDSKYVNEMKKEFENHKEKSKKKVESKLPKDANQYLTVKEIKAYEEGDIEKIKGWGFEEDPLKEMEHREHLNKAFKRQAPTVLSIVRMVRVSEKKYNWETFKQDVLISDVWQDLEIETKVKTIRDWMRNNES